MSQELRHENFTRQGFNVIMTLHVDAIKAMKGGTPHSKTLVTIQKKFT